jgi:hypothetical protein
MSKGRRTRPTSSPPLRVDLLGLDVHDNFVGQDRRALGSAMDDHLAEFAVSVN